MYKLFSKELNSNRIFGLDLLRAYAIILVVVGHGKFLLPQKIVELHKYIDFDGVAVFFVLSGFLIGGIFIKQLETNKIDFNLLLDFWIRRWFRTLPAYFLILIILAFCFKIKDADFPLDKIQKYCYFFQNFYQNAKNDFFGESWSLAVEEWFYLSVPVLIIICTFFFKPKTSAILTVCFIIPIITFIRYLGFLNNHPVDYAVIGRLDGIMYGFLGAFISYYFKTVWNFIPKTLFILGIIIFLMDKLFFIVFDDPMAAGSGLYGSVFKYSITSIGTLLLIPFLSNFKNSNFKIANIITIISLISYSMYLTHNSLIIGFIINNIPWLNFTRNYNIIMPVNYCLYWGLTISISIFLYKFFELPFTGLRDKVNLKKIRNGAKSVSLFKHRG